MGTVVLEQKWPVLGRHEQAAVWLHVWADLGRAPRTMDAYARGLAEYLEMCERVGVDPLGADRAHIARYVRELAERPSRLGANVVALDSGAGLANATLQQANRPQATAASDIGITKSRTPVPCEGSTSTGKWVFSLI